MLLVAVVIIAPLFGGVMELCLEFPDIGLIAIGVIVRTDNASISWDDLTILNDDLEQVSFDVPMPPPGAVGRLTRQLGELTISPGTNSLALISCS